VSERLFFALWPDDDVSSYMRDHLLPHLQSLRGKPQRPDQWHVTLAFLGEVPTPRRALLQAVADRVTAAPFTLSFDAIEYWRRPRVVCMTASLTPPPLQILVESLRERLQGAGFELDPRPYLPHVTLARKVFVAEEFTLAAPVVWTVDRFTLVRSVTDPAGSRYEPLHWWNLQVEAP
jgi:2'-5' RNA ligase